MTGRKRVHGARPVHPLSVRLDGLAQTAKGMYVVGVGRCDRPTTGGITMDHRHEAALAATAGTCTGCGRYAASRTACEGERYCTPCTGAYLNEKAGDAIAAHYGERYRNARGHELPVTPRVRGGLSHDEWLSTVSRRKG